MTELDKRKKKVERQQVMSARMSLELRIYELELEIERLKGTVDVQIKKEQELTMELGE